MKLLNFEIQKHDQILCAHKPYFLIPGHYVRMYMSQDTGRIDGKYSILIGNSAV